MQQSISDDWDAEPTLRPVAAIILGLLATAGPQTSYGLEHNVGLSVGFFWQFPRSQLYAEPQRLESLGLASSVAEDSGRRRRVFDITPAGRDALRAWLLSPAEPVQVRDPALLRLFFASAEPACIAPLAAQRVAEFEARVAFFEDPRLGGTDPHHRRVLDYGRTSARAVLAYWQAVLAETQSDQPS